MQVAMGLIRVQGASSGRPDEMAECITFPHRHNILPKTTEYSLDDFPKMIDLMRAGNFHGRMVVTSF